MWPPRSLFGAARIAVAARRRGNCSFLRKMPPRLPAARPRNPFRFSGTEGAQTALGCEPLNQEYDPLKGDSLVAATRTEKGLDYVRL